MRPWSNRPLVSKTPLATVFLLEHANAQQIYRMWSEGTAEGQSLVGWCSVWIALVLWLNFYRVITPDEKFAFWATAVGIALNTCVIASVVWFRYC